MKALIITVLSSLSIGACAQGTFVAENLDKNAFIDAPIFVSYDIPGTSVVDSHRIAGNEGSAQFYAGPAGSTDSSLIPVGPVYHFDTRPGYAGYLVAGDVLTVPNVPGGAAAIIQLRAWVAVDPGYVAKSPSLQIILGNASSNGGQSTPPATLTGLSGFGLIDVQLPQTPEPSVVALGGLGAVGLLFRNRKQA